MADLSLSTFKSRLKDVARQNRFLVTLNNPIGANAEELSFFIKSATLPPITVGTVELSWQGLKAKLAGDPTYETWEVSLYHDYDGKARSFVEKWYDLIIKIPDNTRTAQNEYKADLLVAQLGRQGEILQNYKLIGAWVSNLAAQTLDYGSADTPQEMSVTFTYDYWIRL